MVARNPSAPGPGIAARQREREVEPKSPPRDPQREHERDETLTHEEWRERLQDKAEELLHCGPREVEDFDIAAWFAVEEESEAGHAPCIAECWYG